LIPLIYFVKREAAVVHFLNDITRPLRLKGREMITPSYSEQDAATILPDCTLSAGTLESAAEAVDAVDGELFGSSSVPVSSTFFPTCGLRAAAFATSR